MNQNPKLIERLTKETIQNWPTSLQNKIIFNFKNNNKLINKKPEWTLQKPPKADWKVTLHNFIKEIEFTSSWPKDKYPNERIKIQKISADLSQFVKTTLIQTLNKLVCKDYLFYRCKYKIKFGHTWPKGLVCMFGIKFLNDRKRCVIYTIPENFFYNVKNIDKKYLALIKNWRDDVYKKLWKKIKSIEKSQKTKKVFQKHEWKIILNCSDSKLFFSSDGIQTFDNNFKIQINSLLTLTPKNDDDFQTSLKKTLNKKILVKKTYHDVKNTILFVWVKNSSGFLSFIDNWLGVAFTPFVYKLLEKYV